MAQITNKTLVKILKQRYGPKWFDDYSHNSIVLEREPGVFVYYDIEKDSEDIAHWINKQSLLKQGDELNRETDVICKMLGDSRAILYVDT